MMQLRNLSFFTSPPQHSTTQSTLTTSSLPRVNKWNQFQVKGNSIKSTRRSLSIWCDGARIRTHFALDIRFLCLFHNSIYSIVFLYPHEKSTKQLLDICVLCGSSIAIRLDGDSQRRKKFVIFFSETAERFTAELWWALSRVASTEEKCEINSLDRQKTER